MKNEMVIQFSSRSENESFARVAVGAFIAQVDPTMDELTEIKTVVSEAVTNSIIHGYNNEPDHYITIECKIFKNHQVEICIKDQGVGINDIEEARQPLFTTRPELERSGMGFTIIENFMDSVEIYSEINQGTTVRMMKQLSKEKSVYKS